MIFKIILEIASFKSNHLIKRGEENFLSNYPARFKAYIIE